ncbi:hypothetical protein [Changchengzhania lutea]|uniref:hypothetical protein n=1 Tax=Changchengzhania lutea TaxID=2049305 RepID=UPI00115D6F8E|nr:hypothetical protein [Changchengzhania lutea]
MKLIQRIGYYLGGFSIGLVILAFFLNGKRTSCSYGPESRVLKNINSKPHVFSSDIRNQINNSIIDSASIIYILKKGDVDFSKSNTRQVPCGVYAIEGEIDDREIMLTVENCDSLVTIASFQFQ